ncbi:MAG: tetratricopeptide repeat protein [Nitrospinae bacterium]|nr:tetratricopeptide repeat protein [Nitrospinota bacterium]
MTRLSLFAVAIWVFVGVAPPPASAQTPEEWFEKAQTLDKQGFLDEAAEAWEKFAATGADSKRITYARLKLVGNYFKLDLFQKSIDTARAAVQADRENFDAYFHLANALSGIRKFPEAIAAFRKTTALKPEEGLGYVGLGLCLFGNRNSEEAIKVILQANKLFKKKKNISWHRDTRVMVAQIKNFAKFPPNFSDLWVTNNLKLVRDTYEKTVFDPKEYLRSSAEGQ